VARPTATLWVAVVRDSRQTSVTRIAEFFVEDDWPDFVPKRADRVHQTSRTYSRRMVALQ
jgi:hypothetical protein